MSLSHGRDEVSGVLQPLSGAEELHVLRPQVHGGMAPAVVAVLQHKHGGPIFLGPLGPLIHFSTFRFSQRVRFLLSLPSEHEEGQTLASVMLEVLPVPLRPQDGVSRVKMVSVLVQPLLREGLIAAGCFLQVSSVAGASRD